LKKFSTKKYWRLKYICIVKWTVITEKPKSHRQSGSREALWRIVNSVCSSPKWQSWTHWPFQFMTSKIAAKVAVATWLKQSLHPRDSPPKWQSQSTLSFSTFRVPAAKVAVAKYSFFTLEFTARLQLKIIKCLNDEWSITHIVYHFYFIVSHMHKWACYKW